MMEEGFHKLLHAFMAENHYSQKEAAAALKVSRTTLCNWLNGATPNGRNMLETLNIMMGSFFGVFVGSVIANYREYRAFPELYEIRSAPWYCYGALTGFVVFAAVAVICVVIKLILRHKTKP